MGGLRAPFLQPTLAAAPLWCLGKVGSQPRAGGGAQWGSRRQAQGPQGRQAYRSGTGPRPPRSCHLERRGRAGQDVGVPATDTRSSVPCPRTPSPVGRVGWRGESLGEEAGGVNTSAWGAGGLGRKLSSHVQAGAGRPLPSSCTKSGQRPCARLPRDSPPPPPKGLHDVCEVDGQMDRRRRELKPRWETRLQSRKVGGRTGPNQVSRCFSLSCSPRGEAGWLGRHCCRAPSVLRSPRA